MVMLAKENATELLSEKFVCREICRDRSFEVMVLSIEEIVTSEIRQRNKLVQQQWLCLFLSPSHFTPHAKNKREKIIQCS